MFEEDVCNESNTTVAFAALPRNNFWALFLLIIPLLTISGNILVVLSVIKERSLHSVTNYLICSLAVADFIVALLVMPFGVYFEVEQQWYLGETMCDASVAMDVAASSASIFNLVAVSVDRYMAVSNPLIYSRGRKNVKRAVVTIAIVWISAILIALPIMFGINDFDPCEHSCEINNPLFTITSSIGSFFLPCLVIIGLYLSVFNTLRERQKNAAWYRRNTKRRMANRNQPADVVVGNTALLGGANQLDADASPSERTKYSGATSRGSEETSESSGTLQETMKLEPLRPKQKFELQLTPDEIDMPNGPASSVVLESGCFWDTTNFPYIDSNRSTPSIHVTNSGSQRSGSFVRPDKQKPNGTACLSGSAVVLPAVFNRIEEDNNCMHTPQELQLPLTPKRDSSFSSLLNHLSLTLSHMGSFRRHMWKHFRNKLSIKGSTNKQRKKEMKRDSKERRATQTLAIVVGVFLLCWLPFFTCHIANAICMKMSETKCIGFLAFFLTTWIGYMNSFMNPIIYTIFNPEFRKAFRRMLLGNEKLLR